MAAYRVDRLSSDAVLLWQYLQSSGDLLFSLAIRDLESILVADREDVNRAVEQLAATGRLRRLRRGVYHVVTAPDPTLLQVLQAVHTGPLRVTGQWAASHHLGKALPDRVDVLKPSQVRPFKIPARTLEENRRPVQVVYTRASYLTGESAEFADAAQVVVDALDHPHLGLPVSDLRQLVGLLDAWPLDRLPRSNNSVRRLALLVDEQLGQRLDVPSTSHATILLDPNARGNGPITTFCNVRVNA